MVFFYLSKSNPNLLNNMNSAYLDSLIISYLNGYEILNLIKSDKYFADCAMKYGKYFNIVFKYNYDYKLCDDMKYFSNVNSINLDYISGLSSNILKYFTNAKNITIDTCIWEDSSSDFKPIDLMEFKNVEYLNIMHPARGYGYKNVISPNSKLKTLKFKWNVSFENEQIYKYLENIEELWISFNHLRDLDLQNIFRHKLNIRYVEFYCSNITDDDMKCLSNVDVIILAYADISDEGIKHLKNVKIFAYGHCDNITANGIENLKNINKNISIFSGESTSLLIRKLKKISKIENLNLHP